MKLEQHAAIDQRVQYKIALSQGDDFAGRDIPGAQRLRFVPGQKNISRPVSRFVRSRPAPGAFLRTPEIVELMKQYWFELPNEVAKMGNPQKGVFWAGSSKKCSCCRR